MFGCSGGLARETRRRSGDRGAFERECASVSTLGGSARRTMPVLSPRGAFKISTVAGRPSAHYRLFLRLRHFDFPMPNDFVHLCVVACPAAASPSSPSRSSAFPRADHSRCESGRCVTAMTRLLYTVWAHDLLQVCLYIAIILLSVEPLRGSSVPTADSCTCSKYMYLVVASPLSRSPKRAA